MQQQIASQMRKLGINQSQLADATGLSKSYISMLLRGERGRLMQGETALKLCRGLKVKVDFLYPEYPQKKIRGMKRDA
jgi:transcriptional regulator with XRE-family HTH domain